MSLSLRLLVLATALLTAFACGTRTDSTTSTSTTSDAASPMTLFDFDTPSKATWNIQNDGVMGGKSKGYVAFADGAMRFTGNTVTAGGGFTSVIADKSFDLSGYKGLELHVRGGGRTFEVDVSDGSRVGRREVGRRTSFETSEDWTWRRIAFADLEQTAFGEPVNVAPVDLANVRSIGLYIVDGQDGDFRLEVDEIRGWK